MTWSSWLLVASWLLSAMFMRRHVGFNLSLTSVLLSMLFLLHSLAYLYYTRVWSAGSAFFDTVVSAARGAQVIQTIDLALCLTFIGVCIGIKGSDLLTKTSGRGMKAAISSWSQNSLAWTDGQRSRLNFALAASLLLLLVPVFFIDGHVAKIITFVTADLDLVGKTELRREGGGSNFYLYNLLVSNVLPFLAFCSLASRGTDRPIGGTLALAFAGFLLVAKIATLSKAPSAIFLLQVIVVYVMIKRLELSVGALLRFFGVSFALFALMAAVADSTLDGFLAIGHYLFYRVFMIVNESLVEYFSAIPYEIDFTWGAQFSWVAALLQEAPKEPIYWLVGEAHRGVSGSTTVVLFVGYAWADFAWWGVAIAPVLVGLLVRTIDHRLILVRKKSVLSIGGLALGHYGIYIAMITPLQTAMLTGGLVLVIPLVYLFAGKIRFSRTGVSSS